jgi:hypothetical protein
MKVFRRLLELDSQTEKIINLLVRCEVLGVAEVVQGSNEKKNSVR